MPSRPVLLDANILLEQLLPGRQRAETVAEILAVMDTPSCITTLTIHLIFHFGRIERIPDKLLHEAIAKHIILPLLVEDYLWAKNNEKGQDFEDALQVAAALGADCGQIITLDKALAGNYVDVIEVTVP